MINRRFTFLKAGIDQVKEAILSRYKTSQLNYEVCYAPLTFQFKKRISFRASETELILWQPENACGTAMFGNLQDGFDTLGYNINRCFHIELTRISLSLEDETGEFNYAPFYKFQHFYPDGRERYVRVMWDNRWEFWEKGEPMAFEQTEKYNERIRRKRLTNDMVLDYVKALGWDLRDPRFWTSQRDACFIKTMMNK
ncbi:hypothetical protein [Alistipes sp.]|uniref:hypothetical protein n=1 Tax=Alistipes sp. TaxID=1872444 RepID=UPI003AF12896